MSIMIIGSPKNLNRISKEIDGLTVDNIYFYNANSEMLSFVPPVSGLIPFVDMVVLGSEALNFKDLNSLIDNAISRNIPIIAEDCIEQLKNLAIN